MKVGEMFANNEEVMLNMQKLKTSMSMLKKKWNLSNTTWCWNPMS